MLRKHWINVTSSALVLTCVASFADTAVAQKSVWEKGAVLQLVSEKGAGEGLLGTLRLGWFRALVVFICMTWRIHSEVNPKSISRIWEPMVFYGTLKDVCCAVSQASSES